MFQDKRLEGIRSVIMEFFVTRQGNRIILFRLRDYVYHTEIMDVIPAEFPIEDAWVLFPLEASETIKKDISGRFPGIANVAATAWNIQDVFQLPIYNDQVEVRGLLRSEKSSCEKPLLAIATRICGTYADERQAQAVSVLLMWQNGYARILELNWAEGPLIDCITPEWYTHSSPLIKVKDATEKFKRAIQHPGWESPTYWFYIVPPGLGVELYGPGEEIENVIWQRKWRMPSAEGLKQMIGTISKHLWVD